MKYIFSPVIKIRDCEYNYLRKILSKMENLSDDYYFIIARINNNEETEIFRNLIQPGKKNVMIMLSDERGIVPPFLDKLHRVFRTYNNKRLYDEKKVFPIPCGYCAQLDWQNVEQYKEAETQHLSLSERKNDIFFSGQLGGDRYQMVEQMNNIKDNYSCIVSVAERFGGFGGGFMLPEYFDKLNNSKISIAPKGVVMFSNFYAPSAESFRFFESFESGCITISSYPIHDENYKHWYYENCPAIFTKDWSEINVDFINQLLDRQEEFYQKNVEYYNKYLSSDAVSNYIKNNI